MNARLGLRCLALAASVAAVGAHAHRPWLLPSASVVEGPTPTVTIDAAVSEDLFEADSFPLKLDALRVTAPDGSAVPTAGRQDGQRRSSFDVALAQPGTYRIAGVTDTATALYKVGGETKRWRGAPDALAKAIPADAQNLQVSRTLARVETFVSRDTPGTPPPADVGVGLELQPLTSPTDLSVGEASRFRLLLDGKPLADADVTVIRGGNRYRYKMGEIALKTDGAGEFGLTWAEAGRYWMGVNHGVRVPGGAPADGRRESYAATFEVLPR